MTTKRTKATSKGQVKKLKVKKETLRDLDAKGRKVVGGFGVLVQEKYTDAYDCTMATCATFCPQQPCQTGNMFCHMIK